MPFSGMRYLDLMLGISSGKKPKNVGKFPLLSVDTFAGDGDDDGDDDGDVGDEMVLKRNPQILPTFPIFQVEKNSTKLPGFNKECREGKFWRRKRR